MQTRSQKNEPFGERLRAERQRLGLTQTALGELGGVSKTSVVGYEAGDYTPEVAFLAGVAEGGVDPIFVLQGEPAETFVADKFNWALAAELCSLVDAWAEARSVPTPAGARWQLIEHFYRQLCAKGTIDDRLIEATFRVAQLGDAG